MNYIGEDDKMSRNNVNYINYKEECLLDERHRQEYLKLLRAYLRSRKLTNTTAGATVVAPRLKGVTNNIAAKLTRIMAGNVKIVCEGKENLPDKAAIFAFNHQGILDNFSWIPYVDRHCIILHSADVNNLLLAAQYNTGLIKVIKGNTENNRNAKFDVISLLMNNHSVVWFPEGAWNLSPNKFLLPIRYGFLDAARIANVPVIPSIIEYEYDKNFKNMKRITIRFGKALYVQDFADLNILLQKYIEIMSTMQWELMEQRGIVRRSEWNVDKDYKLFLERSYKDLKFGKIDLEKERKNIFQADSDFYLFHEINDYKYDDDGIQRDLSESTKYYRRADIMLEKLL